MAKDKNGKELPKGISWLTKKNLYMARFQYQGQSYTMYAKTLREAKKLLADKKYEVEHGINGKADKTTLNEWFSIWIETYKKGKVRATTLDTYMRIYNNHVREALGNRYISKIKTVHIQRFYNDFHDEGFSAKYLETLNAMLSNLFKKALESDLIFKNPCVGVVRPSEVKKERRVLSAFEHTELSSFIMREEYGEIEPVITVLLGTGLRIGELLGMKWSDIDMDGEQKTLSVERTLVRLKDMDSGEYRFTLQPPKTKLSHRTIPLQSSVVNALKRQRKNQNYLKISGKWNPDNEFEGLVFTGVTGNPLWRSMVTEKLNAIVKAYNKEESEKASMDGRKPFIMAHLHPHCFRHSFATRCLEAGIQPKVVQAWLGHSDIAITLNLYSHVDMELSMANMKILEDSLKKVV